MGHAGKLVIFINGDFTRPESGSHIRFIDFLDYAIARFGDVCCYSYHEHDVAPWSEAARARFAERFPGVPLILEHRTRGVRLAQRIKNLLLMLAPGHAARIAALAMPRSTPLLRRFVEDRSTRFYINFADGVTELNGVPLDRAVIDTIDIKYVRYAKLRGLKPFGATALLRLRAELGLLTHTKAVIAISSAEAETFRMVLGDTPVCYVPRFTAPRHEIDRAVPRTIDILFVGSLNHYNVEGLAEYLARNRAWLAPFRIVVAGKVCGAPELVTLAAELPNLELLGFVDDLAALYASAKVVISPVDGTGLNIKVMEALAHGKPVFGSGHALAALPPGHAACAFPLDRAHMVAMLGDVNMREAAETAAERYGRTMADTGDLLAVTELIGAAQR